MASKQRPSPESQAAHGNAARPSSLVVDPAEVMDLHGAPLRVRAELPARWISTWLADTDARADQAGELDVAISSIGSGPELLGRGMLHATILVPCARCLADSQVDVGGEVTWRLIPRRQALASELARAAPKARPSVDPKPTGGGPGTKLAASERQLSPASGKSKASRGAPGKSTQAVPPPEPVEEGEELTSDDLDIGVYDERELDLASLVGELIKAGYPMRTLCEWGEACWGLCPACGLDLQRDDRTGPGTARSRSDLTRPSSCSRCHSTLAWPGEGTAILVEDGSARGSTASRGSSASKVAGHLGGESVVGGTPPSTGRLGPPESTDDAHSARGPDENPSDAGLATDDPRFIWREKLRRLRDSASDA